MATIGFLATLFLGFTLINGAMAGQFLAAADVAIMNNMAVFMPMSVFGWFTVPVPNFTFITEGLPLLMNFREYDFFAGNGALVMYLLYTITAFISFALFIALVGVIAGRISRT